MHIIHVHMNIKPEWVEAFKVVALENAQKSLQEPGIARFDLIQEIDIPTHFDQIEVYRTPVDPVRHRETAHYSKWSELIQPMLAEPRSRTVYTNIFPSDQDW